MFKQTTLARETQRPTTVQCGCLSAIPKTKHTTTPPSGTKTNCSGSSTARSCARCPTPKQMGPASSTLRHPCSSSWAHGPAATRPPTGPFNGPAAKSTTRKHPSSCPWATSTSTTRSATSAPTRTATTPAPSTASKWPRKSLIPLSSPHAQH